MKKNIYTLCVLLFLIVTLFQLTRVDDAREHQDSINRPVVQREHDDDDEDSLHQWRKVAPWSEENAARHQELLKSYMGSPSFQRGLLAYANGALKGEWKNRGANNMPGAFKFAEMLDGTDTVYGVTHNHYSGEYNSKSYIFKGTVYNPKSGTTGDDFVRLTGHWPNRYQNLIVLKVSGNTRLIAGIENGPLYWSDDQGKNWVLSTGLPSVIQSSAINRQDGDKIYATNGTAVYVSNDGGESFTTFQDFGSSASGSLYSPRYAVQPDADKVYLVRSGTFYELVNGAATFTQKGTFTSSHGTKALSIGGDSRKLYVTENSIYWVSTNGGATWTTKTPKGNWYGDRTGKMSAGKFLCVNPENENEVIGGYAQPVFSRDGLNSDVSTTKGWGNYQNGTSLSAADYYDRIRFNYHPDFQASHFFYNSSGDLFSIHCTDGGLFMSYGVWKTATETDAYDNSGFNTADFINITTLGTTCPLIYRDNMFTGYKDETHIIYSTQDQGTQSIIPGTSGELLDFYQSIGGDGPPLKSHDGRWVWKWKRQGSQVWAPVEMYDGSGNMRSAGSINGSFGSRPTATVTQSTTVGWVQSYIDRDAPDTRIWMLNKDLARFTLSGSTLSATTINKGTGHQVCALTQASGDPNKLWMLQEAKVYKSTNRGDSFDGGTTTPFTKTSNKQNMGSGWVLPTDDNWVLFVGPSSNGVGSILSKDGGVTWKDVTGNFPTGDDFQASTMEGTPDGKYVFAGTDIGPWVFVVATEEWYPIGEGGAYFNAMDMEYIASTNTMRFGSWGSGVWDFRIVDGTIDPFVTVKAPNGGELLEQGATTNISWSSYVEGDVKISLLESGSVISTLATVSASTGSYSWTIASDLTSGKNYSIRIESVSDGAIKDESDGAFTIQTLLKLDQKHLGVVSTDSEESNRPATNTIDGDGTTFWHTEWSQSQPDFPHEIVYSCDTAVALAALEYTGRQDGSANGHVKGYEVYLSKDGASWTKVATGNLSGSGQTELIAFDTTMKAEQIKFVALSEVGGGHYASASEINLYYIAGATKAALTSKFSKESLTISTVGDGLLSIPVPENMRYEMTITGVNGRRVFSQQGVGRVHNFSLKSQGLAQGIYVVHLQCPLGTAIKRVTVK